MSFIKTSAVLLITVGLVPTVHAQTMPEGNAQDVPVPFAVPEYPPGKLGVQIRVEEEMQANGKELLLRQSRDMLAAPLRAETTAASALPSPGGASLSLPPPPPATAPDVEPIEAAEPARVEPTLSWPLHGDVSALGGVVGVDLYYPDGRTLYVLQGQRLGDGSVIESIQAGNVRLRTGRTVRTLDAYRSATTSTMAQ